MFGLIVIKMIYGLHFKVNISSLETKRSFHSFLLSHRKLHFVYLISLKHYECLLLTNNLHYILKNLRSFYIRWTMIQNSTIVLYSCFFIYILEQGAWVKFRENFNTIISVYYEGLDRFSLSFRYLKYYKFI